MGFTGNTGFMGYISQQLKQLIFQQHQREKRIIVRPTGDKNTARAKGMTRRVRRE